MSTDAVPLDRIAPTRRPLGRPIGFHRWSNLLFVHWSMPAALVCPLLPPDLTLDTWEGDALLGLVPFHMSRVRPWWSPPVAGISSFCETNVRTYVYDRHRQPGVWFFSLEAACSLAVRIARWKWSLPYYRAAMELERQGSRIRYASRRLWPGPAGAHCRIAATIGDAWEDVSVHTQSRPTHTAVPDSIDHFLIERYILYARSASAQLLKGRVHHPPYELRRVVVDDLDETLTSALGLAPHSPNCHTAFCEGVNVEIFPLEHDS